MVKGEVCRDGPSLSLEQNRSICGRGLFTAASGTPPRLLPEHPERLASMLRAARGRGDVLPLVFPNAPGVWPASTFQESRAPRLVATSLSGRRGGGWQGGWNCVLHRLQRS
jgi:hypothetical protein